MADLSTVADHIVYLLRQGGWFMLILFLMGQAGWTLAVERWWYLRRAAAPGGAAAAVAREVTAVRGEGHEAMIRKAREIVGRTGHGLHRHLGTIAALAAAAPMMGLAGTVSGVMKTFGVITLYGAGNPAMMAGGIAEALMVTEAALVIALPLMLLHDRLQARADAIEDDAVASASALIRGYREGGAP